MPLSFRMHRAVGRLLPLSAAALLPMLLHASKPAYADTIGAYMVMEICADDADHPIPGRVPTDADCTHKRKIREGEALPYHLSGFDQHHAPCPAKVTTHDNLPVTRNGVTRAVTAVDIGYDLCAADPAPRPAHYEVHWYDPDYAFVMGSWGRNGVVGGGLTPKCNEAPHTSARFFRSWSISASVLPPEGSVGYTVFTKHSFNDGNPPLSDPCPETYRGKFLALWTEAPFRYLGGMTLQTVLSHPYSQTDNSGTTPGKGEQMERTYWTREFGLTRWEGWKRDDYRQRKTGEAAIDMARASFDKKVCSKPFEMPAHATPGIELGPVQEDGAFFQTLTDLHTGEKHTWYLAECQDATNIVRVTRPTGDPFPSFAAMPPQFWDFWVPAPAHLEVRASSFGG